MHTERTVGLGSNTTTRLSWPCTQTNLEKPALHIVHSRIRRVVEVQYGYRGPWLKHPVELGHGLGPVVHIPQTIPEEKRRSHLGS